MLAVGPDRDEDKARVSLDLVYSKGFLFYCFILGESDTVKLYQVRLVVTCLIQKYARLFCLL